MSSTPEPRAPRSQLADIAKVIEVIRPAIQADNGDIELRGYDPETGHVFVELFGACTTCPASTRTLSQGVERIMKSRLDGVTKVVQVGLPETPIQLRA